MRVLHQIKYTAYVASPQVGDGSCAHHHQWCRRQADATHQTPSLHCLYSGCNVLRWPRNISFVYSYHQITFVIYRKPTHEKQEKQDAKTRQQHHADQSIINQEDPDLDFDVDLQAFLDDEPQHALLPRQDHTREPFDKVRQHTYHRYFEVRVYVHRRNLYNFHRKKTIEYFRLSTHQKKNIDTRTCLTQNKNIPLIVHILLCAYIAI